MQPLSLIRESRPALPSHLKSRLPLCEQHRIHLQLFRPTLLVSLADLKNNISTVLYHSEYAIHDGTKVIAYKLGNYVFNYYKIY